MELTPAIKPSSEWAADLRQVRQKTEGPRKAGYWLLRTAFVLLHDHKKMLNSTLWNPLNVSA